MSGGEAHYIANRRSFLGGYRALCGKVLRDSAPGRGKGTRFCAKCERIQQRNERKGGHR